MIKLLNEALATEIVCVLRYKRHYFMANGIHAEAVAQEFLEHADEEQGHADLIAERIAQLRRRARPEPGGARCSRSHAEYVEGDTLIDMIQEDLVAERIAIDSYSEIIRYLGDDDPTTRRLMEQILASRKSTPTTCAPCSKRWSATTPARSDPRRVTARRPRRARRICYARSVSESRRFLIYWAGQTLSAMGDAFAMVALPLLVLEATGCGRADGAGERARRARAGRRQPVRRAAGRPRRSPPPDDRLRRRARDHLHAGAGLLVAARAGALVARGDRVPGRRARATSSWSPTSPRCRRWSAPIA